MPDDRLLPDHGFSAARLKVEEVVIEPQGRQGQQAQKRNQRSQNQDGPAMSLDRAAPPAEASREPRVDARGPPPGLLSLGQGQQCRQKGQSRHTRYERDSQDGPRSDHS